MSLSPNTTLAHYTIVSKIGAGGMGEVYRARDARLDREVAIKLLPAAVSSDADRLKRFEQEARATSALNHPNILTVYDIGTHNGSPYIVAELLKGGELRDRLDAGTIPMRKAIDYAQQIVSGLSAAHEKGIVHRDLKPENLFVTNDDRIKILDFGLAKLSVSREVGIATGSEDATRKVLTNPGVVMGTVGYMSPEQVRGEKTDHRSDIFSFGAILHEMIAGQRAFRRETMAETMTAILREQPDELSGRAPAWRGDGKEIFCVSGDYKFMSVEVTTRNSFEAGIPKPLFDLIPIGAVSFSWVNFAPSLDGQQFLLTHQRESVASLQYVVVQNWVSEKK